jgi:hypothetical protein
MLVWSPSIWMSIQNSRWDREHTVVYLFNPSGWCAVRCTRAFNCPIRGVPCTVRMAVSLVSEGHIYRTHSTSKMGFALMWYERNAVFVRVISKVPPAVGLYTCVTLQCSQPWPVHQHVVRSRSLNK